MSEPAMGNGKCEIEAFNSAAGLPRTKPASAKVHARAFIFALLEQLVGDP